jgi:hypothetical protein
MPVHYVLSITSLDHLRQLRRGDPAAQRDQHHSGSVIPGSAKLADVQIRAGPKLRCPELTAPGARTLGEWQRCSRTWFARSVRPRTCDAPAHGVCPDSSFNYCSVLPSVLAGQSRAVPVPGAARCTACPGIRGALIEPFPPAQIVFQVTRNWPKPLGLGGHLGNSPRSRSGTNHEIFSVHSRECGGRLATRPPALALHLSRAQAASS